MSEQRWPTCCSTGNTPDPPQLTFMLISRRVSLIRVRSLGTWGDLRKKFMLLLSCSVVKVMICPLLIQVFVYHFDSYGYKKKIFLLSYPVNNAVTLTFSKHVYHLTLFKLSFITYRLCSIEASVRHTAVSFIQAFVLQFRLVSFKLLLPLFICCLYSSNLHFSLIVYRTEMTLKSCTYCRSTHNARNPQ